MKRAELTQIIEELKLEYIRVQDDMEKLVSLGHTVEDQEKKLTEIEEQLATYHKLEAQ